MTGVAEIATTAGPMTGVAEIAMIAATTAVTTAGAATTVALMIGVAGAEVTGRFRPKLLPSRRISNRSCGTSSVISGQEAARIVEQEAVAATGIGLLAKPVFCFVTDPFCRRSALYRLVHASGRGVRRRGKDGHHCLRGGGC